MCVFFLNVSCTQSQNLFHSGTETLTMRGLNGGLIFLCSKSVHSISLKKEWLLMASSKPCITTQPSRLFGLLVMNWVVLKKETKKLFFFCALKKYKCYKLSSLLKQQNVEYVENSYKLLDKQDIKSRVRLVACCLQISLQLTCQPETTTLNRTFYAKVTLSQVLVHICLSLDA